MTRGRLYCGYDANTNESTSLVNAWDVFPFPSTGYTVWRDTGHFTIDGSRSKFTWTGMNNTWVYVDAVCNVYKGSGGNATRNIEVVWRLNGTDAGPVRGSHMNDHDSIIISGSGWFLLSNGDYIEPYIRNIENDDKILLKNCVFSMLEDSGW